MLAAADDELEGRAHLRELDAEGHQGAGGDGVAVAEQRREEMLRSDVVVVVPDGFVLGEREHAFRVFVEAIEALHPR